MSDRSARSASGVGWHWCRGVGRSGILTRMCCRRRPL